MMSESYVAKKLEELEKLDINSSSVGYDLQKFYGILEVLGTEAYEEGITLSGIYKKFSKTYSDICEKRHNMIMEQFEKDRVICDRILKSMEAAS